MTAELRRHLIAVHFWTEAELDDFLTRNPMATVQRIHGIEHENGLFEEHAVEDLSDGTATV